jgi:1,4-dihydroxy-2-naphthoate octaprenyltransferase
MAKALKALIYIIAMVLLGLFSFYIFHFHPEIQFAFLIPGVFLVILSAFLNDFVRKAHVRGK